MLEVKCYVLLKSKTRLQDASMWFPQVPHMAPFLYRITLVDILYRVPYPAELDRPVTDETAAASAMLSAELNLDRTEESVMAKLPELE